MRRRNFLGLGLKSLLVAIPGLGMTVPSGISPPGTWNLAAIKCFLGAVTGGPSAQFRFGEILSSGWELPQDETWAVEWYRKAATGGHAEAMLNLSCCYSFGLGIKQDLRLGTFWCTKSAELGIDEAQYRLGDWYKEGENVTIDFEKAAYWYQRAANQGHNFAMGELGQMYAEGLGLPRNIEEAMAWTILAMGYPNDPFIIYEDLYRDQTEEIATQLSPTQLARVGKLVLSDIN